MARRADHGAIRDLSNPIDLQKLLDTLQDIYSYLALPTIETVKETTDATVTTLATLPLTDNRTIQIVADVVARRTGGSAGTAGDGASYRLIGTFRRVSAGSATLIGSVTAVHTAESQGAWDCTLTASGNDVLLRITGATNNNMTWRSTITIQEV